MMCTRARRLASLSIALVGILTMADFAAAEPFLELPNGSRVYSSGIDVIAGVDQRYAMTLNPFSPGSPTANANSAGYLSTNNTDSAWIGPAAANVNTPESIYRVRTLIDLTGVSLTGLTLVGHWVSDNQGLDILVNGNPTGSTNNGAHQSLPSASTDNQFVLDAAAGLVAGINVIEFEWGNGPAGGAGTQFPNPTHVRVEFSHASIAVPGLTMPAGLLLLITASLAGLLVRRVS